MYLKKIILHNKVHTEATNKQIWFRNVCLDVEIDEDDNYNLITPDKKTYVLFTL